MNITITLYIYKYSYDHIYIHIVTGLQITVQVMQNEVLFCDSRMDHGVFRRALLN